jgi:uncharacterized protein (DUF1015 family)
MADIKPFRAVRYTGAAGPLADLVAPPYDAVDEDERAALYSRSPYNVVHVTLPDSAAEAARLYTQWLADGILESESSAAQWLAVEDYVGPDGVARRRHGLIVSVLAEPYATAGVLPHERTHPRIRDERLALLRMLRVQPEPILLLADTAIFVEMPVREPDLEVGSTRLWRLDDGAAPDLTAAQLLVADGHHRYESALALGDELDAPARIMALVVSKEDPGVHIFPTHRTFADRPDLTEPGEGEPCGSLDEALAILAAEPEERASAVAYRDRGVEVVRGPEGVLDVELVDLHGLDGIGYTPRVDEAVAAVDSRAADVAFLLREPSVDAVFEAARLGRRMPQKSTYFFPKPLSGLLFHPVTP